MHEERTISVDGRSRRYLLGRPTGDAPAEGWPLILAFHGGGGWPEQFSESSGLGVNGPAAGFVVAFAEGTGPRWPTGQVAGMWNSGPLVHPAESVDDVAFAAGIVDAVDRELGVDRGRVYGVGHSNGGMLCYLIACERADLLTAIAVAGCSIDAEGPPSRPVSVLHLHGTADKPHPYEGGTGIVERFPGPFLGGPRTVERFVAWNHCRPDVDGSRRAGAATFLTWTGGDEDTEVVLCRIDGAGHLWPGHIREDVSVEQARAAGFEAMAHVGPPTRDVDATDEALAFFARHRRST